MIVNEMDILNFLVVYKKKLHIAYNRVIEQSLHGIKEKFLSAGNIV